SGADPLKVGWQATIYESRTALLPFIFIFNTELLMIDIGGAIHFLIVLAATALAMMAFVSVTQRWLLVRNRWYECVVLLLVCSTRFRRQSRPHRTDPPFIARGAEDVMRVAEATPKEGALRLRFESERRSGKEVERVVRLTLGAGATADARIRASGLTLQTDD